MCISVLLQPPGRSQVVVVDGTTQMLQLVQMAAQVGSLGSTYPTKFTSTRSL